MKRVVIGVLISMLMIGSVLASATVVTKEIGFEDGEITVSIPIGDYEIENKGEGVEIKVENFGRYLVSGKPNLPCKIFSIAIPPGSELVDITFQTAKGIVLPGSYNVLPCELPQVIGKEDPLVRQKEEQIYQENYKSVYYSNNPYPSSNVEFVSTCIARYIPNLIIFAENTCIFLLLKASLFSRISPFIKLQASYTCQPYITNKRRPIKCQLAARS